jgi:hypothetical protein
LDDICPSCSTKAHPFEARLRRTLVGIKIAFREQLFREQPDEGLAFSRTKSYAKKKYGEAWVMHQQCAVGLIRIADALRLEFPGKHMLAVWFASLRFDFAQAMFR